MSNINWEQDCIEEIRSGVLLCRIIEFFERKQLTGVTEPKTTAAALKNIKIFIDFLSKFPNFPS